DVPCCAFAVEAGYRPHARADPLVAIVDEALEILDVDAVDGSREQLDLADGADAVAGFFAAAHREPLAGLGEIALEALALLEELRKARVDLADRRLDELREMLEPAALTREMPPRCRSRQRLDAAHAGRDRALRDDAHKPDVA